MLLIPCPWCGPRSQIEFTYGGDATVRRPALDAPEEEWFATSTSATTRWGRTTNGGLHSAGCRQWFDVRRDTRTHEILGSAAPGEAMPQAAPMTQPCRLPTGGIVDRARDARVRVRRLAIRRLRGRHARLRASRQRRAPRRPQLQVSPAARHLQRRRRRAERAGAARARRAHRAECPRDHAGALRTASSQRARTAGRRSRSTSARSTTCASRLIPAGFYYKTFMWPPTPKWWLRYEHLIRHAAGMGRAASAPDPDALRAPVRALRRARDRRGPCRPCRRARSAAHAGARVLVVRREPRCSAAALSAQRRRSMARMAVAWVDGRRRASLRRTPTSRFSRGRRHSAATTAIWSDWSSVSRTIFRRRREWTPRQRLWKVRATLGGARDRRARARHRLREQRPAGHDARRRRAHLHRALRGAARIARRRLHQQRQRVRDGACAAAARASKSRRSSIRVRVRRSTARCRSRRATRACRSSPSPRSSARTARCVWPRSTSCRWPAARAARIDCDLVALSGGWNPAVHLHSQARGKLRYDDDARDLRSRRLAGADRARRRGQWPLRSRSGADERSRGGIAAAERAGLRRARCLAAAADAAAVGSGALQPLWSVRAPDEVAKRFVDLQNDVTVDDIALAAREGYQSVEHLKRYTTLGMGTDQGKVSNIVGLALLAKQLGRPIAEVGTTTFRPPYTPVALGAFPGTDAGTHVEPTRYSAMHDWHVAHGARFVNAGLWKRPHSYPRAGETRGRRRSARGAQRPRQRRRRRRVDARQDRAAGTRCRGIPESRLHQPLGHARRRPLPLRRDAARRRHRASTTAPRRVSRRRTT